MSAQIVKRSKANDESSNLQGIGRQIARPTINAAAPIVGAPQDVYQVVKSILEAPGVAQSIEDKLGWGRQIKEPQKLPERIPLLPTSQEFREGAQQKLEPYLGEDFINPKGSVEETIDRFAMFIPSALYAVASGGASLGSSLATAGRSAVGGQLGKELIGGIPGEIIGQISGDILGKNVKKLGALRPKNIHSYMKNREKSLWGEVRDLSKGVKVDKKVRDELINDLLTIEKEVEKGHANDAQKSTLKMISNALSKINKQDLGLEDLIQERKNINDYFRQNVTPYQEGIAKYVQKKLIPTIDSVIETWGSKDLQRIYNSANALTQSTKLSEDLSSAFDIAPKAFQLLKDKPWGAALGGIYAIPKLMPPTPGKVAAAAAAYGGSKAIPLLPYLNPKNYGGAEHLLKSIEDVALSAQRVPFNKQQFLQAIQTYSHEAQKAFNQSKQTTSRAKIVKRSKRD